MFPRVSESDSLVMGGLIAAHFLSYLTSHMGLFKISGVIIISVSRKSGGDRACWLCVVSEQKEVLFHIKHLKLLSFQLDSYDFFD